MTNRDNYGIVVYTADDIRIILSLGKTKTYELMRSDGFPSFKLNNRLYVTKENFEKWLNKHTNKAYKF